MRPDTVLLIEDREAEVTLVHAALALKRPQVRVLDSPDILSAVAKLRQLGDPQPLALAIVGPRALTDSPDEVVRRLRRAGLRGPVVGIAFGLSPADRRRAIVAGVREIHERPTEWRPYSELIDSLVSRFTRKASPPRRGPTS